MFQISDVAGKSGILAKCLKRAGHEYHVINITPNVRNFNFSGKQFYDGKEHPNSRARFWIRYPSPALSILSLRVPATVQKAGGDALPRHRGSNPNAHVQRVWQDAALVLENGEQAVAVLRARLYLSNTTDTEMSRPMFKGRGIATMVSPTSTWTKS